MSRATNITNIVLHCSAGFGNRQSIEAYWRSLGWKSSGYHRLIDLDGTIHNLLDFEKVSNGVKGWNKRIINICYIGGVDRNNVNKAMDTRTDSQKASLHICIQEAIMWLQDNGKDLSRDLGVVGHRDFSHDANNSGVIESWERIKECPSFDVLPEYSTLYATPDRYNKLPTT